MAWRKDIVKAQWREERSEDEFQDLGDAFLSGTLRRYPMEAGHKYEGEVKHRDGRTHAKMRSLRKGENEKRVELRLRVEDEPRWLRFPIRAASNRTGENGLFRIDIVHKTHNPFES